MAFHAHREFHTVDHHGGPGFVRKTVNGLSNFAERLVYMLGGILLILLAIRVLLSLFGASRENAIADFVYSVTHPFVSPFFGLFGYDVQYGTSILEIETIIALISYAILTVVLARLVTFARRDDFHR